MQTRTGRVSRADYLSLQSCCFYYGVFYCRQEYSWQARDHYKVKPRPFLVVCHLEGELRMRVCSSVPRTHAGDWCALWACLFIWWAADCLEYRRHRRLLMCQCNLWCSDTRSVLCSNYRGHTVYIQNGTRKEVWVKSFISMSCHIYVFNFLARIKKDDIRVKGVSFNSHIF